MYIGDDATEAQALSRQKLAGLQAAMEHLPVTAGAAVPDAPAERRLVGDEEQISGTPQQSFKFQAPMAVLSLMRSVGTPLGFANEEQPWVSSTIWRTVSDSTNRVVIFDSALTPATFWVKLDELDLKPGAPVKKLELKGGKTYSGNAVGQFVDAKLFTFQDLTDVAPAK